MKRFRPLSLTEVNLLDLGLQELISHGMCNGRESIIADLRNLLESSRQGRLRSMSCKGCGSAPGRPISDTTVGARTLTLGYIEPPRTVPANAATEQLASS